MSEESTEKVPFVDQLKSFSGVFWVANWMEVVERFAYYGVRVVLPIFMVLALEDGGPELDHVQKGTIYSVWALVQSYVPIFSGVYADRYGYKANIAVSTVLKIIGYLIMGYCVHIAVALAGMPLSEARPQGSDHVYGVFFTGAMFLALGTAIFKPGIQGLIANQLKSSSSSLGWAVFYQMVNVGGFIGPLLAGYLRVLKWEYVFIACAVGIALNFVPLFFFEEPDHGEVSDKGPLGLLVDAVRGLLEPRLFFFTVAFAGFWLMFYQLFDILPNFIDDWVDSRAAATALQGLVGESLVPTVNGGNLTQAWIINFNALLISLFAFAFGYLTGKVRALSAIIIGIFISTVAIYGLGLSMSGWWILAMIGLFSFGEMTASPTKHRYLASIAPPGQQGQYMGYLNMTVGLGWSIGSIVAGEMYQSGGDKVVLARRYLVEVAGVAAEKVDALGKKAVLPFFEEQLKVDAWGARELLWNQYHPYGMWKIFAAIGVGAMLLVIIYNQVTRAANDRPSHSFNTHGQRWVQIFLVPVVGAWLVACVYALSVAVVIQTVMFTLLLVASFARSTGQPPPAQKAE
ncbi:MAG: MFS transporter [Myxococcales bacterium]|nr:MFS transporter [Myxococcales bacterium]